MRRAASAAQLARGLPFHLVGRLRLAESAVGGGARKAGAACRDEEHQAKQYCLHVADRESPPGNAGLVGTKPNLPDAMLDRSDRRQARES